MAYDPKLLGRAKQRQEDAVQRHGQQERQRLEGLYRLVPRLGEVQRRLQSTTSRIIALALRSGTDATAAVEALRHENLSLQQERAALLQGRGLGGDALDERPLCPLCDDHGYRGGIVCGCLRQMYVQVQQEELSTLLDLGNQSFETFSLEYYSRESVGAMPSAHTHMGRVLEACRQFARTMPTQGGNLLLFGQPGLGKTFLSAAIAREVNQAGCSVVYDTAGNIFSQFEDQKFRRDQDSESAVWRALECDLLIIDDVGTEMVTAMVQSSFYEIVNKRLLGRKSTVISTNLTPQQIGQRYSPQIASRLQGEYECLPFIGEDIRPQKARERKG